MHLYKHLIYSRASPEARWRWQTSCSVLRPMCCGHGLRPCVATGVSRPLLRPSRCDHVLRPRVEATALRPCVATVVLRPSRCDHGHQGHADAFAGALQLGEVISLRDLRRGALRLRGFQVWQLSFLLLLAPFLPLHLFNRSAHSARPRLRATGDGQIFIET